VGVRQDLGRAAQARDQGWSDDHQDLFTVETIRCKTPYALFFIELGSRRVQVAGVSARPDSGWVTQQARNLALSAADGTVPARFLIHDRDAKFSGPFEEVFRTEGTEVILTPIPGAEGQRIRRTVGRDRPGRVPRPRPGARSPPPRTDPAVLYGP
jgi:hypothetical protein